MFSQVRAQPPPQQQPLYGGPAASPPPQQAPDVLRHVPLTIKGGLPIALQIPQPAVPTFALDRNAMLLHTGERVETVRVRGMQRPCLGASPPSCRPPPLLPTHAHTLPRLRCGRSRAWRTRWRGAGRRWRRARSTGRAARRPGRGCRQRARRGGRAQRRSGGRRRRPPGAGRRRRPGAGQRRRRRAGRQRRSAGGRGAATCAPGRTPPLRQRAPCAAARAARPRQWSRSGPATCARGPTPIWTRRAAPRGRASSAAAGRARVAGAAAAAAAL